MPSGAMVLIMCHNFFAGAVVYVMFTEGKANIFATCSIKVASECWTQADHRRRFVWALCVLLFVSIFVVHYAMAQRP